MGSLCGSNTVVQNSQPPAQVLANYSNLVSQGTGTSNALYGAPGPPVAGLTPEQYAGLYNVNQAAGIASPYFSQGTQELTGGYQTQQNALNYLPYASGAIGQGLSYLPSEVSGISGAQNMLPQAQGYLGQGANLAAMSTVNPVQSGAINEYMSPYNQDVVAATEAQFNNQNAQQANNLTSSAIMGGNAFGGDRAGVAQAVLAGQQQTAEAPVIAGLYNQNYSQALGEANTQQQLMQSGAGLFNTLGGTTGSLAGTAGGLAGLYGSAASTSGGLGGLYNTLAGTQSGIGSGMAGTGTQTAALGPAATSTALGAAGAQIQGGTLEQQTQQAQLNSAYQQYLNSIGVTGTNFLAPLVEGTGSLSGGQGTTSQTPSLTSQLAGLGITGAALYGSGALGGIGSALGSLAMPFGVTGIKRGGRIGYDDGGSAGLDFGTSGDPSQQSQSLNPVVSYDALSKALAQGLTVDQLAQASLGGFADGGTPDPNQPGLASLQMGLPSNNPAPFSTRPGMGPPGMRLNGGPPPAPNAMQDSLSQMMQQVNQVAGMMRLGSGKITQNFTPSAFGGRVGSDPNQSFRRGGFADGGDPNFDQTFGDASNAPSGGLTVDQLMASQGQTTGPNIPVPMPRPAMADAQSGLGAFVGPSDGLSALAGANPAPAAAPIDGVAAIDAAAGPAGTSRGLRNNNPGNIEDGPFARSLPGYAGTDGRFATFKTIEDGQKAQSELLDNYGKHGVNTINGIVSRWAPSSDGNDTGAYAKSVATDMGVDPNQPLDMSNASVRSRLATAMAKVENGGGVGATAGARNVGPSSPATSTSPLPSNAQAGIGKPDVWQSLLAAGLGMMAGSSGSALTNIGKGGLAGLENYNQQQEQLLKEAGSKQAAQRLSDEANFHQQQIKHETDQLALQQTQHEVPAGYRKTKDGTLEAIPGGPADIATVAAQAKAKLGAAMLSGDAIEMTARRDLAGDPSGLNNIGRGAQGSQNIAAVRSREAQILKEEMGLNDQEAGQFLANKRQQYAATGAGLSSEARTAGTREANLNMILATTESAIPAALEASKQVARTGWVPINQIIQRGEVIASDPNLKAFGMANLQLAEGWARAMNPTGVMRESDRDKALSFLNTADSPETYERAVNQLRTQITRERDAVRSQRPAVPGGAAPSESKSETPTANAIQTGDVRQGYRFKGGDPSQKSNWEKI